MTYSTDNRVRSTIQPTAQVQRKVAPVLSYGKTSANLSTRLSGEAAKVRNVTNLHRSVMLTLEQTKPGTELHMRLSAFAEGVSIAIELAEAIKTPSNSSQIHAVDGKHEIASLQDLSTLANAALDGGRQAQGLKVLEGIGFLLGGIPRAALERALGFLRLKQKRKACDELEKAVEGLPNDDGLVSALLVQLWFEVNDKRWMSLAKRVMATGLNVDARGRCAELLSTVNVR